MCLVLLVAPGQANIDILGEVGRNHLAELFDVLAVDLFREAESSIDDTGIKSVEALSDRVGTCVIGVQSSYEDSLLAVVVELVVNGAHGKDGALEFVQSAGDFRVLASGYEAVLKDITEAKVLAFG
jgi:hypothetical protein